MSLLVTILITYNRLHLTEQAVSSYRATVTIDHRLIAVDNASTDGTREWLADNFEANDVILLDENRYPGYACNRGWEHGIADDTQFLHRADNDFVFLPGWCRHAHRQFQRAQLGQLGLRTDEEELFAPSNVGGNCIIRRELWDQGLRYDERPWGEYVAGYSEDSYMSPAVVGLGYTWGRVKRSCIESRATGDWDDPYYQESYGARGITP